MKCANALIMITLGGAMLAAPQAAPEWFPRTGIDGTSTRALWMSVVGTAQCALAILWLGREALARWWQRIQATLPTPRPQPEQEVEDLATPLLLAGLRPATVVEPADSITLNGEYAELWRAFQTALASQGPAAQLAEQAVALARREAWSGELTTTTLEDAAVPTFTWTQDDSAAVQDEKEPQYAA